MPEKELVPSDREWFGRAARIWVDMERGLYDWGEKKPPRNGDGSLRVVKSQILKDLDITVDYHNARERVWQNPHFQRAVEIENRRRDVGIADVIKEIEAVSGPISELGDSLIGLLKERIREDPDDISTKELLQYGPGWVKLGLEIEGRLESQKEAGIGHVLLTVAGGERPKITVNMVDDVHGIILEYRKRQDRELESAGIIEGELEDE